MSDKPRTRLFVAGQTVFRRVRMDKGWRGPYGQTPCPAKWACIECGRIVTGTNDAPTGLKHPWPWPAGTVRWIDVCARNGHAPCAHCGKVLPRLNDGCPRAHPWQRCPGKTEAARMIPQHAAPGHVARSNP